jgi:hypothetical protein
MLGVWRIAVKDDQNTAQSAQENKADIFKDFYLHTDYTRLNSEMENSHAKTL